MDYNLINVFWAIAAWAILCPIATLLAIAIVSINQD
jgi:hypothetical protein